MRQIFALSLLLCVPAYAEPRCTRGSVNVDREGRRLEVALSNECDALVSCKVSWRVQCGHEAVQDKSEDVRIDARAEQRVTASAAVCGEGDWYIAPPKWRCEETITDGDKPHRRARR